MAPPGSNINKTPDYAAYLTVSLYVILLAVNYKKMTWVMPAASLGVGCLVYAIEMPLSVAAGAAAVTLLLMTIFMKNGKEGFNTRTPATAIAKQLRSQKQAYKFSGLMEGFEDGKEEDKDKMEGYEDEGYEEEEKEKVEGYEDVKKAKDENPAPASESVKENMAIPFKLGEIPSQVKNGPHLDAASTLVKAIKSLDPDQINAMSKDTQQLIETQKSLMNMMGSMKPMLNDGKELMDTFQQMFGK